MKRGKEKEVLYFIYFPENGALDSLSVINGKNRRMGERKGCLWELIDVRFPKLLDRNNG